MLLCGCVAPQALGVQRWGTKRLEALRIAPLQQEGNSTAISRSLEGQGEGGGGVSGLMLNKTR